MSKSQQISITKSAANRVGELIANEGVESLMLRVMVSAGGCSGFEYSLDLDKTQNSDDTIFEIDGNQRT